ncbi:MAG: chemotaxis protein CheW, partial [Chthoniobacteraceae bacterium]
MAVAAADKFLLFRIAGQRLAFPLSAVCEVLPAAAVTRPLDAPPWLLGFLRLGPETLPVAELAVLLGLPGGTLTLQSHFIRPVDGPVWFVDRVEQIVAAPELTPLPDSHFINEYAAGSFHDDGGEVIVLRLRRLLLVEERERIAQITQREHARRLAAGVGADA